MQSQDRQQRLAALRDMIADIERKPALADMRAHVAGENEAGFPRLAGGIVQEVFTDAVRNGGASLAFALGQGRTLLTARRPALLYIQLVEDGQFFGLPYGPGLHYFGLDADRLVIVRAAGMAQLLWTAEEALSCAAIAGIVADIGARPAPLDFTASRRLSLRASAAGASLFLLRYGRDREASAAHLRWRLTPQYSARHPHDARSPGAARWHLRLERGLQAKPRGEWLLEWTQHGFSTLPLHFRSHRRNGAESAFPRAVPALLGDRLSQAG